jgi:predicted GIY-YIG superfamily endonuclease
MKNFMINNNLRQTKTSLSNDLVFEHNNSFKPQFDGSVNYNIFNAFVLPKTAGVYFIHDFRGVLYIGESLNIKNRFIQHHTNEENTSLSNLVKTPFGELKFSWVKTKNKSKAMKIQKEWIRFLDPQTNNIKYKTNRRSNDDSTSY